LPLEAGVARLGVIMAMTRLSWMRGRAVAHGAVFVSATRFTYRRMWHMPFVFWHGMALRRRWSEVDGAIGMFTGGSLAERTTYTLSAWSTEPDLARWLRSPEHARLMRDFQPWVTNVTAVSWLAEAFEPRAAWREGLSRLEQMASPTRLAR
jgi:hypothetical protein